MKIHTTYSAMIRHYNHIFNDTAAIYRDAVDFFIHAVNKEWDTISAVSGAKQRMAAVECMSIITRSHPNPKYDFSTRFYKFPSYLRRAAIN